MSGEDRLRMELLMDRPSQDVMLAVGILDLVANDNWNAESIIAQLEFVLAILKGRKKNG